MLRTTFKGLWARKRRLIGTSLAVILGVGFLAATLLLGNTLDSSFRSTFAQANAGTDVVVRSSNAIGTGDAEQRDRIDRSLVDAVRAVPGVASAVPEVSGPAQILGKDGKAIGGNGPPTMAANWITDPDVTPYRISEGRAPAKVGEVVLDAASARTGQLHVGDTATLRTPDPLQVRVVGLVRFGDQDGMIGATYVGFTNEQAVSVLGQAGQVSDIRIHGDGTTSPDTLRAKVATVLPHRVEALTGAQLTDEQQQAIQGDFLGFLKSFLLAFAVVALVVATFSIHNTFTILIAQRTRESALLRAIGASRRQVLTAVGIEAVAIGAVASALGLAAGVGLGLGLKALLGGFGLDLPGGLVISSSALVGSFAVGLVVTVLASAMPAVRASRVAPIEALRDAAAESAVTSKVRIAIGSLVALVGIALVVGATSSGSAMAIAGLGALFVLAGAVALGPVFARPASSFVGAPIARWRGQPGRLARLNAMRNPRRTAGSALALVIGTAVVALFATFGASIRTSIDHTVQQSFGGDLVLTQDSFSGSGISAGLAPEIAKLPQVAHSVALADATVTVGGSTQYPTAADPKALASVLDLDVQHGSIARMQPGQVAVTDGYATDHHLRVGSPMTMRFVDGSRTTFRVGAVYGVRQLLGDIVMTKQDWAPHAPRPGDVAVLVGLKDGVSLQQGRTAVEHLADRYGSPTVEDRNQYIDRQAGQIDQLLTLVYGLLGLAVIIALMGIANTLSLSIHERSRELGLLRALGLSRGGVRATVRWESVITAVVGTAVGLAVGTFLGWGIVRALAHQEGFITFTTPTATLGVVLVLAAGAGVVASLRPARRAARLDVLDALAQG